MAENVDDILELARATSRRLASGALTPACAKLYSQHTRLDAGQPGLSRWRKDEAETRLEEAVRLIDAGLLQRDAGDDDWSDAVLRAAELLEWLSHPDLNEDALPLDLMSAAAYQLAGYPARAGGILRAAADHRDADGTLRSLLRGDFPLLLRHLVVYWSSNPRRPERGEPIDWSTRSTSTIRLRRLVEDETASALGVLCAAMRWGQSDRIDISLDRLSAVSKFMLNGRDRYSWLLAKLTAETARSFVANSLRTNLDWLPIGFDRFGKAAVERYLRQAYVACKTQAWPSQMRGIERIRSGGSFVLCTPTGSGKTTVAEIAILQRLFAPRPAALDGESAPLVMYLVPKRALAAEVEAKLQRTIAPLSRQQRVVITGLYGGIDWGPTDAWLTSDERTVLICTYEKAEALIRFLGPLFLGRLALVVLDEAHMVRYDGKDDDLRAAESRPLRLESLVTRLLTYVPADQGQVIALSAVAAGMEAALAQWVTGDVNATPARTLYRSTRQLIGRLLCKAGRAFDIRYDLLDRSSLRFDETGSGGTPFIPQPFPPHPRVTGFEGPEKRMRPYLFWAAMQLVAPANAERKHAVLVSIPQRIGDYAKDFLDLIEEQWAKQRLPNVFTPPVDPTKLDLWQRCLRSCEDYFGADSREYRLLAKGIVVHHGKMPGLMARLLVQLVDESVVHLILATSTLSEGVNLPFEVVLLPSLRRGQSWMEPSEIANLAGRAGRPGYGTEGKCLVLLPDGTDWSANQARAKYEELLLGLEIATDGQQPAGGSKSPLAELLTALYRQWSQAAHSTSQQAFLKWLESTATLSPTASAVNTPALIETLDSLDSVLLAAIVEVESLTDATISSTELEAKLAEIWRRSYAHYAAQHEALLGGWFLRRGLALRDRIYTDPAERRRLYRSGLPPRLGDQLSKLYPSIRKHLRTGNDYASRDATGRFAFFRDLVALLASHPRFAPLPKTPKRPEWEDALRWWLDPKGPVKAPGAAKVSDWYDFVATSFGYRLAWGIGCILALAVNEASNDELRPTTLDTWADLDLPWVALWLKELLVWGTLDPVTAYLLGRGRAGTRDEAAAIAANYYASHGSLDADEQLNPRTIRAWAETLPAPSTRAPVGQPPIPSKVKLERTFPPQAAKQWRVLPADRDDKIFWIDPAGYVLASSKRPPDWASAYIDHGDFFLDVENQTILYRRFL